MVALAPRLVRLPVRLLALTAAVADLMARQAEPAPDLNLAVGARLLLQLVGLYPKAHEPVELLRHLIHQIAGLPIQGPQRVSQGEGSRCDPLPELCWVLVVVSHRPLGWEIDKAPVVAANNLLSGWAQGIPLPQHSVGGWLEAYNSLRDMEPPDWRMGGRPEVPGWISPPVYSKAWGRGRGVQEG